jgi:hypothetical protein
MVERLPRYRPLGARIESLPGVSFTTAGAAQARASNQIADSLNKITKFAIEVGTPYIAAEAEKYRIENPVTKDQVEEALTGQRDINEIVGDRYTVWGRASRAAAAVQLRTELENEINIKVSEYNAKIEGGVIVDPDSMITELEGIIKGHEGVIAQIDVEQALGYRAAATTFASTAYKSALTAEYKLRQATRQSAAELTLGRLPTDLYTIYSSEAGAEIIDSDGIAILEADAAAAALAKTINNMAIATGDPDFIKTAVKSLTDEIVVAKQQAITDHVSSVDFAATHADRVARMRAGDYGRHTKLFNTLTREQQSVVRTSIRERNANNLADDKSARDELDLELQGDVAALSYDFFDLPIGSKAEADALEKFRGIAVMSDGRVIDGDFVNKILESKQKFKNFEPRNFAAEYTFEAEIRSGRISDFQALRARGEELGIGPKVILENLKLLDTEQRQIEADIARLANNYAKIVPGTLNPTKEKSKAFYKFTNGVNKRYLEDLEVWESSDKAEPAPSKLEIARGYDKFIRLSEFTKNIEKLLEDLNKNYGGKFSDDFAFDEFTTFDAIKDNPQLRPGERDEIKRKIGRIKKLRDDRAESD